MKPYQPYCEEAFFIEWKPGVFAISFRGIDFVASNSFSALGTLLFGLRPRGFNFRCISDPRVELSLIEHAAGILHLHANGDRHTADGQRRISDMDLIEQVQSAVDLAPTPEDAEFVRKCIAEALGPYAFLSDEEINAPRGRA